MRAVAAVPTEGKRFLTHENKPPLSSKMKSRETQEESWENITVNMTTMRFLLPHIWKTLGKMIADYNWSTENVPIS